MSSTPVPSSGRVFPEVGEVVSFDEQHQSDAVLALLIDPRDHDRLFAGYMASHIMALWKIDEDSATHPLRR